MMIGKTIHELSIGEKASASKTISESDVYLYAGITGDFNPAHVNQAYAEATFFKSRIAHGLLSAGFISAVIANRLPGPGTIYIRQQVEFTAPVYFGDTITAEVEVLDLDRAANRAVLKTLCTNQREQVVIRGEAVVSPPKPPKKG